ncbi:MAG: myo-inositol 2-dehydrogenase/D-chiro-inositol 1-dehydrogenase [Kiritimatiellia bacterium]|jgi:myo-inositol 2-dehydrogenase / D-chiro-inositol 1-dehydrogenase
MKRRTFLKSAGALGFPTIIPSSVLGADAPSNKITMGFIGVGDHGVGRNLNMFIRVPDARVVAVCDVFKSRQQKAAGIVDTWYQQKGCAMIDDFRALLARDDIDAVQISTPDHWHVPMSLLALRAGKDVICEKPTLTVRQGQALCKEVRKQKAIFQTSTEDRSIELYHRMAELVRNGRIGKLERVEITLPTGFVFPNEEETPVPNDLDYDMWLGPAPVAPFTPMRTHKDHWRCVWDYSGGKFSDWGAHQLDTTQWANDSELSGPVEVHGKGTVNEGSMYNTFVHYDINYTYANGVNVHVKDGGTSLKFYGSEGWLGNAGWRKPLEASSEKILESVVGPEEIKLPIDVDGEHFNFIKCVKSREDPYLPAEIGHRIASMIHIGNISMRQDRRLQWDPVSERFVNDDAANKSVLMDRPMRAPWDTLIPL